MVILNIYHKAPVTPVPTWLKRIQQYFTRRRGNTRVEDIPENRKQECTKGTLKTVDMDDVTQNKKESHGNDGFAEDICKHTEKVISRPSKDALREEWQAVARLMDQIFFIVFVSVQVSLMIGAFGIIPWIWNEFNISYLYENPAFPVAKQLQIVLQRTVKPDIVMREP